MLTPSPQPPIWELAHPNGASIFIRHDAVSPDGSRASFTFGPFLFTSFDEARGYDTTCGPYHLLRPLSGQQVRLQQVRTEWATSATAGGAFCEPSNAVNPDCIVVGDLLLPLTHQGALIADQSLAAKGTPGYWSYILNQIGIPGLRYLCAQIIRLLVNPGLPH